MTAYLLGLGFVLGLRHALDADHLAAVATIVSERASLRGSSIVGVIWGIGHTITLLVAAVIILSLDLAIPEPVGQLIELAVSCVLILMGFNLLRKLFSGGILHHHPHKHGQIVHTHPHVHANPADTGQHSHVFLSMKGLMKSGARASLLLGMLHGLAGSAALMLVVAASIGDMYVGLMYVAVFGVGSIGGMWLMSTLMGLPFLLTGAKHERLRIILQSAVAVASIAVGTMMGVELL